MDHKPLTVILTFGSAQDTFTRHLPLWLSHAWPLLVVDPENDRTETEYETWAFGKSERAGPESLRKHVALIEYLITREEDFFFICEYDSFSISPEIPLQPGITATMLPAHGDVNFTVPRYTGFPWLIDRGSLVKMVEKQREYPNIREGFWQDRWFAALAHLSGVPMFAWEPNGFCRDTILENDFKKLGDVIDKGVNMIHGVKNERILNFILKRRDYRNAVRESLRNTK